MLENVLKAGQEVLNPIRHWACALIISSGDQRQMARLTILFGIVLILLGVFGFVATGSHAPTALIPSYIGVVLAVLGFFAHGAEVKRRMLLMHIAVTLGLLGCLGTIMGLAEYFEMLGGRQFPHPAAIEEKAATCVLLLVFVILCVRSFIAARRARHTA